MVGNILRFAAGAALAGALGAQAWAQDEGDAPSIAGLYDAGGYFVHFLDDGQHIVFSATQGVFVVGEYTVENGEMTVSDRGGPGTCGELAGRYAVAVDETTLTLTLIEDACEGRVQAIEEAGAFTRVEIAPPDGGEEAAVEPASVDTAPEADAEPQE